MRRTIELNNCAGSFGDWMFWAPLPYAKTAPEIAVNRRQAATQATTNALSRQPLDIRCIKPLIKPATPPGTPPVTAREAEREFGEGGFIWEAKKSSITWWADLILHSGVNGSALNWIETRASHQCCQATSTAQSGPNKG